jgi:pimeloyl-ACP methyl ester carboxylesterase
LAGGRITVLVIAIKTLRIWAMTRKTLRLSDGSQIGYIESGQGEALVLLHGVGMCAEAWVPQISCFTPQHRVIALDMPGHGLSDLLQGTPELPDYVDWAATALRQLDVTSVNIAGHSMGALVAAGLAVDHPNLLRRLAVLNAPTPPAPQCKRALRLWLQGPMISRPLWRVGSAPRITIYAIKSPLGCATLTLQAMLRPTALLPMGMRHTRIIGLKFNALHWF